MALECKVLISKESGVKIEVLNEDKKTTQTFHMDGLQIEMKIENTQSKKTSKMVQKDGSFKWTVEGQEEKTSIEQTDELVEIKCKDFKVSTRETIKMESTKSTEIKSKDTLDIASTKKMAVKSSDAMDVSSTKAMKLSTKNKFNVDALQDAGIKSKTKASVEGLQVAFEGKSQAELKGAMVKVEGKAQTGVKGQLLSVEGTSIMSKGMWVHS